MFEALSRIYWQSFTEWLETTNFRISNPEAFQTLQADIDQLLSQFEIKENVLNTDHQKAKEIVKVNFFQYICTT